MYIYIYIYICVYIYIYIYTHIVLLLLCPPGRHPSTAAPCAGLQRMFGKGQTGSALMGSLHFSCFLTGNLGVLPLTYFYLSKSARAYLFPQSVKIHYFCSGPSSVDPICPQPRWAVAPQPLLLSRVSVAPRIRGIRAALSVAAFRETLRKHCPAAVFRSAPESGYRGLVATVREVQLDSNVSFHGVFGIIPWSQLRTTQEGRVWKSDSEMCVSPGIQAATVSRLAGRSKPRMNPL